MAWLQHIYFMNLATRAISIHITRAVEICSVCLLGRLSTRAPLGSKNKKAVSFSTLFFMFTLTWITEKELERVIENRGDEFRWKKKHKNFIAAVRNASGQQGATSKVKMSGSEKIKANMNTGKKIFGKHIRQFFHKNNK